MVSGRVVALVDQVLSNASNSLFVILVAGAVSPSSFGRFTIGYAVLASAVSMWRNGLGLQVSVYADQPPARSDEEARAIGMSLLASPLAALAVLLATVVGSDGDTVLAWGLALTTPFVLTQDVLRFASVAAGVPRQVDPQE